MRSVWLGVMLFVGCAAQQTRPTTVHVARFEPLEKILANANAPECTRELKPIPATVIDVGEFKNVPYQSFSNGLVEFNAYGDPNHLVAIEAGTKEESAKLKGCLVTFIAMQARSSRDREQALSATRGRTDTGDGLSIQTTDATEPDAYGAWWFTLHAAEQLASASASEEELHALTTPMLPTPAYEEPGAQYSRSVQTSEAGTYTGYQRSYRPTGGRTYVHGYTRKDGTYVRPHTRRR